MSFYKMWSDDKNDITQCTNVDMDHQILPNAKLSETKGGRSLLFILIWTASLNCMFFFKNFLKQKYECYTQFTNDMIKMHCIFISHRFLKNTVKIYNCYVTII